MTREYVIPFAPRGRGKETAKLSVFLFPFYPPKTCARFGHSAQSKTTGREGRVRGVLSIRYHAKSCCIGFANSFFFVVAFGRRCVNMTMTRLLSAKRLRRVAPEQYHALATEQKQLDILLNARIQARTIASAEGRRLAKENSPASTVPLHLIRRASPSNRSILELTCIKLETTLETRKDRDREQASSEAEAGFRVALADDDDQRLSTEEREFTS